MPIHQWKKGGAWYGQVLIMLVALCKYCVPYKEPGRVECTQCEGYRNPNRRQARKQARREKESRVAYNGAREGKNS